MRLRITIAAVLVLALAVGLPVIESARGADTDPRASAATAEEYGAKQKGNGFVRALKAPFKAFGRLFGGGRKDDKTRGATAEEIRKFQTVASVRVTDARTAPAAAAPQPREEAVPAAAAPAQPREGAQSEAQRLARESLAEGRALLARNNLNEAISRLSGATTFDPALAEAHYLLGNAYALKGLPVLARESYERALRLAPDDSQALSDYGYTLFAQGDYKGAVKHLKRAVKVAPSNRRAWNNLALAQCRLEKFDDAFKSFARAGGEFKGHMNVGNAMERAGRDRDAIEHYEAARRLEPASRVALQHLADIYQRTGNPAAAAAARDALAGRAQPTMAAGGN